MTMKFGERQVAPTIKGIRRDHVARYEFAARVLPPKSRVIDFACGVGYGSAILAEAGHRTVGLDRDREAIDYALMHYVRGLNGFAVRDATAPGTLQQVDAAVCFETIEHIEDPRPLLLALRDAAPMLIASVPNEAVYPFAGHLFHFRHYTRYEFTQLLQECGWCAVSWYGQEGPESEVEPDVRGRTLIVMAQREALPERAPVEPAASDPGVGEASASEPGPGHVAILGLGPSLDQFLEITKRLGGRQRFCDEVWAINALGGVFDCDLVFHMDDVRIQEVRAAAAPSSNIAALLDVVRHSRVPVVTSRVHPDYPALVEFPLEQVLNDLGHDYFNSTAAYAVAFAIYSRATKISCFGMDFTYPKSHDAEKGRGCVEFWLGQAAARGIKLALPKTTTLMDACYPRSDRLYGYDTVDVDFQVQPDGKLKLGMVPRETLPTAEEIEARYDHSLHTNAIVAAATSPEVP